MAADLKSMMLCALLGAAVVALGVFGYAYYRHTHNDEVRIDFPGFWGTISKDKGVDIEGRQEAAAVKSDFQ
jgi:hypothetical protein